MIMDRNNTDRSRMKLIFPHPGCKLMFSVDSGEPDLATLRYYKSDCACCPKISYLGGDDLRRLKAVLKGESSDENFGFLSGAPENDKPYIRFVHRNNRAHFHSCHEDEAKTGHKTMTDFERRLLIASICEVLACEQATNEMIARYT